MKCRYCDYEITALSKDVFVIKKLMQAHELGHEKERESKKCYLCGSTDGIKPVCLFCFSNPSLVHRFANSLNGMTKKKKKVKP